MVTGALPTGLPRIFLQSSFVSNQRFHMLLARPLIRMATTRMSPSATAQG